jgi:hypothetical protein
MTTAVAPMSDLVNRLPKRILKSREERRQNHAQGDESSTDGV